MSSDVPEEVIAEGSGPHDVQELADAAEAAPSGESEGEREGEPAESEAVEAQPEAEGDPDAEVEAAPEGAAMPQPMDDAQLVHLVEALVFAAEKPVTVARLRQLTRVADVSRIEAALAQLAEHYTDRGIMLQSVSGGYQFRTATPFSPWVQQLVAGRPVRLTRAQLETLAIVAYRQPITRPEIDEIRGVDSSNTLRVLAERALVRILGKKEDVGRPLLYGTTKEFLDFFSLSDLRELPTLREYSELTAESRQLVEEKEASGFGLQAAGPVPDPAPSLHPAVDPPLESTSAESEPEA